MGFFIKSPAKMSCQARILDKEFVIPGTTETCHMTKECGGVSFKKVSIDDSEGLQHICKVCVKRFMTKGTKQDSWYGWFDCDYPAEAHVKFSPWYYKVLEGVKVESTEVAKVTQKMSILKIAEPVTSKKDMLLQEIASVEAWIRGEGKTKNTEQPKMLKKLLDSKKQLKALTQT